MLKQAWKARKKIRAKRKRKKQQRGRERSSTSTETKRGMRPQAGTGDRDEYSTFATEGGDQEGAAAPLAEDDDYEKETGTYSNQPPERSEGSVAGEGQGRPHETRVTKEAQTQASPAMGETASVVEETPPDWGDEDSPGQDQTSSEPQEARHPHRDLGAMRPRTPSRSPRRPRPNRGRERPRTPSRSPPQPTRGRVRPRTPSRSPRRVTLRPGPTWSDVQRVQDHMKACRERPRHT